MSSIAFPSQDFCRNCLRLIWPDAMLSIVRQSKAPEHTPNFTGFRKIYVVAALAARTKRKPKARYQFRHKKWTQTIAENADDPNIHVSARSSATISEISPEGFPGGVFADTYSAFSLSSVCKRKFVHVDPNHPISSRCQGYTVPPVSTTGVEDWSTSRQRNFGLEAYQGP